MLHVIASTVLAMGFCLLNGWVAGYSSLIGGLLFALPQLYFGFKAFLYIGARSIHKVIQNFYKGESSKLLLIILGFAATFIYVEPLDHLALFITFISIVLLNVFSPALFEPRVKHETQ